MFLSSGAIVRWCYSHLRGKDMTIIICHNKPPERKRGWTAVEVNWVGGWRHVRKRWSWEFEDFEKTGIWGSTVEARGWVFRIGSDHVGSQPAEMNWDFKHHKMHRAWGEGQYNMVSIDFLWFVSLSSCCQGLTVEINKFVHTACICIFIAVFIISLWLYNDISKFSY